MAFHVAFPMEMQVALAIAIMNLRNAKNQVQKKTNQEENATRNLGLRKDEGAITGT